MYQISNLYLFFSIIGARKAKDIDCLNSQLNELKMLHYVNEQYLQVYCHC